MVETRIHTFYLFIRNADVIREASSIHKEIIKINSLVPTNSISFGGGGDPGSGGQAIKRSIFFENVIIIFHNAQTSRKMIQLITVPSVESCLYNTDVHSHRYYIPRVTTCARTVKCKEFRVAAVSIAKCYLIVDKRVNVNNSNVVGAKLGQRFVV